MLKKPLQALITTELNKLNVPPETQLQQPSVISATISKIITHDASINAFHHKMVHYGICFRYGFALALAANKKAFAAYAQDKRIKALPRPPKNAHDTLVSLFNATYADPKKASKYFKRIEHLWAKRTPVKAVSAFLQKEGLSEPPAKGLPPPPPPHSDKTASNTKRLNEKGAKTAISTGHRSRELTKMINKNDPPGGSIGLWPGIAKAGQTYKLMVKICAAENGDWVSFELLDVPELQG